MDEKATVWSQQSQQRTGRRILGHEDLVLHPINEEAVVFAVVVIKSLSERNQLDGLTLAETENRSTRQPRALESELIITISCLCCYGIHKHVCSH